MTEGDADFIAEHYVGHHIDETQKAHGDSHEQELWTIFPAQMNSAGPGDWMYNGNRVSAGVPRDLGFYIGYKICRAYYERAGNKRTAFQTLLSLTNEPAILASRQSDSDKGRMGTKLLNLHHPQDRLRQM